MGRPLNKRYFGPPTDGGDEIRVRFWDGTTEKNGWIVKQTGAKRFVCTDGVTEAECYLSDTDDGSLGTFADGRYEMTITVLDDTATARQVRKISGRKVTAENDAMYPWVFTESNSDGAVQVEEAGGAAQVITVITQADPAVVTIVGHGYSDGDLVTIDGGDMVELATAGVAGGSNYYIDVLSEDTFALYTDAGLTTSVDSSLFTAYTTGGTSIIPAVDL